MQRLDASFVALLLVQAIHSVEEYFGRLYESFPPARFLSGLISDDPQHGFLIGNVVLVALGLWCLIWPVRKRWRGAITIGWLWVAIELVNGTVHSTWTLVEWRYTPGVATAPLLLFAAVFLARELRTARRPDPAPQ